MTRKQFSFSIYMFFCMNEEPQVIFLNEKAQHFKHISCFFTFVAWRCDTAWWWWYSLTVQSVIITKHIQYLLRANSCLSPKKVANVFIYDICELKFSEKMKIYAKCGKSCRCKDYIEMVLNLKINKLQIFYTRKTLERHLCKKNNFGFMGLPLL